MQDFLLHCGPTPALCSRGAPSACVCSSSCWHQASALLRSQSVSLRSGVWGRSLDAVLPRYGGKPRILQGHASPVAYMDRPKQPVVDFFNKVLGALPIVGLMSRIMSDEGGVGSDRLRFIEFCTKVQKNMSPEGSRAFYTFAERHGKVAKPQYVLIWCWAAAVGAGMLKSEELLLAAARLRVSYDIQYETETFDMLMDESSKKRAKSKAPAPNVPMLARVDKAFQGICTCCVGTDLLSEEDAVLITTLLFAVFPTVEFGEIDQLVRARLAQSAESSEQSDGQNSDEVAPVLSQ